jgi:methylmalonyl-CoA carboxyltransferase 12S subunit
MSESISADLRTMLQGVQAQLADLSERMSRMEKEVKVTAAEPAPLANGAGGETAVAAAPTAAPAMEVSEGISEEELLAISAAVAAWLGVRAHIRQVRLIRTGVWAQEGRVTIQGSHWLHR